MVRNAKALLLVAALSVVLAGGTQAAGNKQKLKSAVSTQESAEKAAAASQKKIDSIADQTDRMLTEYKLTMRQYDALKGYDDQVPASSNPRMKSWRPLMRSSLR